mmetsp:Transcript_22397/g.57000  ORF Transcript_22397/g.57000 Transcript_22397/m.57000 type:complete len:278 (-) Transcript_22397:638-1471(-)
MARRARMCAVQRARQMQAAGEPSRQLFGQRGSWPWLLHVGKVRHGAIARHDFVLARRDAPEGQCAAGRQDAHASEHAQHAIPPRTLLQRAEREAGEGTAGLRDALDESPRRAAHARWDNLTRKEAKQHVHRESAKADVEVARLDQQRRFDQAHGEQPGRNHARADAHDGAAPTGEEAVGEPACSKTPDEAARLHKEQRAGSRGEREALRLREEDGAPVGEARSHHRDAKVVDTHQPERFVEQHRLYQQPNRRRFAHGGKFLSREPLAAAVVLLGSGG